MSASRWTRSLQLTLAVIKPDAVAHPVISQVRSAVNHCILQRDSPPAGSSVIRRLCHMIQRQHIAEDSAVHQRILNNNFLIVRSKELRWRISDSQNFYHEHTGRFFYQRLVEFMSSGPMRAYILAHEDAIQLWRKLMGPTKVFKARMDAPETVRGELGLTDTRNTTHGSDSIDSACREISFFFPDFNVSRWYEEEEPVYRAGPLSYDEERLEHRPVRQ